MAARTPSTIRPRLLIAALGLGFVGFSGAAVVNQAVGRFAALPEDAKPIHFSDVPVDPSAPASTPVARSTPDDSPGLLPSAPPAPVMERAPSLRTYTDSIVRRNIFDSTAVYDPNAAVAAGGGECKEGGAKLLATIVADDPGFSSALVSTGGGRDAAAQGVQIGDEVSGEGRIVTIEQKRVCMDNGSCLCMGGETGPAKGPVADKPEDGGVSKLAEGKFSVEQSVLDDAMGNFETLATQLKVYPHKGPDGQVDGYRVSSIRPNSLFAKLGIKNGDIVHGVNGQPLNSPEGALSTYQQLKTSRSFSFDITRKNQKQTLEYEVH